MAKDADYDIDKLKRELEEYRNEIERLYRERSDYLRISAHQMKSPLATISFNIETLLGEYAGRLTSKQIHLIESVKRSTESLQNLIRDILELEKLRSGAIELVDVDYTEVCMRAVDQIRDKVQEKGLYFEVSIPNKSIIIKGNQFALEQMLLNLLENAVKYTEKHGVVIFSVDYDENKVNTIVKDTGIGIPEQDQKRIFEEFYRAPNAKKYDRSGTGFGMAIVKQIVYYMHGSISLRSKEGEGTEVTVIFPIKAVTEKKRSLTEGGEKRKRIVIIGGVAAGPKAASRARRLDPNAEITLFEKGYFLAYAGCALPFYIAGELKNQRELSAAVSGFEGATEFFRNVKGIEIKNLCEVTRIDRKKKIIEYHDLISDRSFTVPYDKLVVATGSRPNIPKIPGVGLKNIFTIRGIVNAEQIKSVLENEKIREIIILGGGLIGTEIAEAFTVYGARVTIVEKESQILPFLDPEMALLAEKYMEYKGIKIIKNNDVREFIGNERVEFVQLSDYQLPADLVILAVGIKPEVEIAKKAGIKIGPTGAIKVNNHMQTNDPDIYAAGDCCECLHIISKKPYYLPLGSIANRQARVVGTNITGGNQKFPHIAGTVIIKVFDCNIAKTGLTEKEARECGLDVISCYVSEYDREHFVPGAKIIKLKLIACKKTGRILGAQLIGEGDVVKRIDIIATALYKKYKVNDLASLDLGYTPAYANAMGILIVAANVMQNKLEGRFKGMRAADVYKLLQKGYEEYLFLDVRTPQEYEELRIPGFDLIPLEAFRRRLDEIPRDKKIILACESGKRSYQASLILNSHGYKDVWVLEGGLRMWPYKITHE